MHSIGSERQRLCPNHGRSRQGAMNMGEKRSPARALPDELGSEPVHGDRQQHQSGPPGEVLGGRSPDLARIGEMDEAVAPIVGRSGIASRARQLVPVRCFTDFVDQAHLLSQTPVLS